MSEYFHQSDIEVALAAMITIQESFQQSKGLICVNTDIYIDSLGL